ncbi:MAG: DUF2147 domain-containing protein [Flavobacteriaceae bacterium]|nr:DUF2147 domain-containing protein [Flavobacteriaceae bacterium]
MIRNNYILFCLVCLLGLSTVSAQGVFGKWKTIDDVTGKARSCVEIYEEDGKVYGKIIKLINIEKENPMCDLCCCEDKGQPIIGMQFLRGLKKDGDKYNGGKILDPKTGKIYDCYITLEEDNILKVRGYINFPLMGRTQYWYRTE